jgi:hypothetical protein
VSSSTPKDMRDKAASALRQSRTLPRTDEERRVDRHMAASYKNLAASKSGLEDDAVEAAQRDPQNKTSKATE